MKQLTTLLTLALMLFAFHSNAQHQHTERCGHNALLDHMEAKLPGYKAAVNSTFETAKLKSKEILENGREEVYTIPVVVHIVYNSSQSAQNLPDSMIEDQIRILNEDFRLQNPDAGNIRSEFADVQGDAMIEFELKQIIRRAHNNPLGFIPLLDDMKRNGQGGSNAVDPEHTLNIWVCEMFLGLVLGYAYPPANLINWPEGSAAEFVNLEGVVIDYRAFASNNPASSFYENQGFAIIGRTTTHEVGHYLGLRHYWGDGDCNEDDGIDDTPPAAENSQTSGCQLSKNTCGAGEPGDLPDMWENYMDYSEETCQVAFTNGQIALMRAVLECPRVGLIDTNATAIDLPLSGIPVGPALVPEGGTVSYIVTDSGNEFVWEVTGGTIISGQGTNTIQVTWGNTNPGKICLTENNGTCSGIPICLPVTIDATCSAPVTGTISGNTSAETSTTETYTVANSGNSYTWSVTGGTITSGQGSNTIQVSWAAGTSGEICLVESDGDCDGNEECLAIVLCTTPTTGAITGATSVEVTTSETYSTASTSSDYFWEVTGGTITSGTGTNSIVVTWGNGTSGQVCLTEGDGACLGAQVCTNIVLTPPTGIEEIAYRKALTIYPNPATSFISVKANEVPNKIELYDVLGSLLQSKEGLQLENTLYVNELNTKIVLVKVYFKEGFAVRRIVID